jgi:hypothetical protein
MKCGYYEKNEIKRFYDCCNYCKIKIMREFLEKEITKNYNYYLSCGLNDEIDDVNEYYFNLYVKFRIDKYEKVTEVLHEIYKYENDQ